MLKKLIFAVLAISALLGGQAMAGDLDGTTWKIREKGIMFWRTDTLKFDNGQFTSVECVPHGFNASAYNSTKDSNKVMWSIAQTNGKGEKMDWKGTTTGDRVEGSFVWTKTNGKTMTCSWKGSKKS